MAEILYKDRVREDCQFDSVNDVTLLGEKTGYTFFPDGNTDYTIHNTDGTLWEVGEGVVSGGVLTRTLVYLNHLGTTDIVDFGFGSGVAIQPVTAFRMNSLDKELGDHIDGSDPALQHPDSDITVDAPFEVFGNQHGLNLEFDNQIALRETAATGVIEGGLVTNLITPATVVDITAGSGEIVDGYTDRRAPVRTNITWIDTSIDISLLLLDKLGVVSIFVDNTGIVQAVSGVTSSSQKRTRVTLASVFYADASIDFILQAPILSNEVGNTLYDWITYTPLEQRTKGLALMPNTGTLQVYMEIGDIFGAGANAEAGILTDINVLVLDAIGSDGSPALFDVITSDGAVITAGTSVLPTAYESDTTLHTVTNLPSAKSSTIHYMYRTLGGKLILQLGQIQYASGKDARDAIPSDRGSYIRFTNHEVALFSAQVYMEKNATDFTDDAVAGIVDSLSGGGSSQGSAGPSVNNFLDLTDVSEPTYLGKAFHNVQVNNADDLGNGDALIFGKPSIHWAGLWAPGFYEYNWESRDGDYLGIVNNILGTSDRLAPQPVGAPLFTLPDPPPWVGDALGSDVSVVECIHDYTMNKTGWIQTLRVWSPSGSANPDYTSRIYIYDVTDSLNPILRNQINDPILLENAWTDISVGSTGFVAGTVLRVVFLQAISADGVNIAGGWQLGAFNSGGAPATGGWNSNNNVTGNATLVRIDKTDLDGTNRTTELSGIVENSTIRFVQTDDPTKSVDFTVASPTSVLDQGTYFAITVDTGAVEGSNDRPDDNAVTTMDTFVPVAVPTDFVQELNWWLTNQPSFATVTATLKFDGVEQIGGSAPQNAYGIDFEFQEAVISPNWDIKAIAGSSGGSSGGGGGTSASEFVTYEPGTPDLIIDNLVANVRDALDNLNERGFRKDGSLDMTGDLVLSSITPLTGLSAASKNYVDAHSARVDNPHSVTYAQLPDKPSIPAPQTYLHEDLTDVSPNQHHNKLHTHDGLDGSGSVDYSDILNTPPAATFLHADLTDVTADQHHAKSHVHDGVDGSGQVDYSDILNTPPGETPQTFLHEDLTDIDPNQHHNKLHTHDGLDGSGTVDYGDLTGTPTLITDHGALGGLTDDDHTQYHNNARGDLRYSLLAHNHSGVYEPVDTTILRDADIGVNVEAFLNNPVTDGYMLVSTIAGVRTWVATDTGPTGPTGPAGADGLGWTAGSYDGVTGIVTFTSDDGLGFVTTDLRGADGADGAQGIQGDTGAQGIQGIQGIPGTDGVDGNDGATGATGPEGPSAVSVDIDNTAVLGSDNLVYVPAPISGASTYLELTDTPASYAGQAGNMEVVNPGETAVEFVAVSEKVQKAADDAGIVFAIALG